jgi:hypothetical protein
MDKLTSSRGRGLGGLLFPILGSGLVLLVPVAVLAGMIRWLHAAGPGSPERMVLPAGLAGMLGIVIPVGVYLTLKRRESDAGRAGLIVLASMGAVLLAFYAAWVSHYVEFPADILACFRPGRRKRALKAFGSAST